MAQDKATIVVFTGCAAAGMDTTLFFTFWGLNAIRKDTLTGKGFMAKMLGLLNRGGLNRLPPSKFNFGGMGRRMFKKMMDDKGVTPLEDLRQTMLDLDVHMLACEMSMKVMEIDREDLIDGVENVVGVATFVKEAAGSAIQLFV
jgi:peroxiredoxin family protein